MEDKTHPTISEITAKVREVDPGIGQATVYRNINKMVSDGLIIRLPISTEAFHYDGDVRLHDHFVCRVCGKIYDLFDTNYADKMNDISNKYSFKVEKCSTIYEGICLECQK
jgi:Fe2+ or Zn2+ uptake regulation protein